MTALNQYLSKFVRSSCELKAKFKFEARAARARVEKTMLSTKFFKRREP